MNTPASFYSLARMLAPTTPEAFVDEYWESKPLTTAWLAVRGTDLSYRSLGKPLDAWDIDVRAGPGADDTTQVLVKGRRRE